MKRGISLALAAVIALTGCNKQPRQTSVEASEAEELFDYFTGGMRWDDTIEFEMDEFPDVKFVWDCMNLKASENGSERALYSGMPIWSVYFCDLNGDGKREIISGISLGSGIIDDRILVCDYANGKLYSLSDRFNYDFVPLIAEDGTLQYSKRPYAAYSDEKIEPVIEPLTMNILRDITDNNDIW